jgi:hypothetical protein
MAPTSSTPLLARLALVLAAAPCGPGCAAEHVVGAAGLRAPEPIAALPLAALATADLDGDGHLDVIGSDGARLCALRGLGQGALAPAVCQPLPGPAPTALAARPPGRTGPLGQPGTLAHPGGAVLVGQALTLWAWQGDRLVPELSFPLLGPGQAALTADLDGDGLYDVAVAEAAADGGHVALFRAEGGKALAAPVRYDVGAPPSALLYQDLDGDRVPELYTTSRAARTLTAIGPSARGAFDGCDRPLLGDPRGLAATAGRLLVLDGDELRALRVRSGPRLDCGADAGSRLPLAPSALALLGLDLDGDGDNDAVVVHGQPAALSLFRSTADALYATPARSLPAAPLAAALGDLDGDGRTDVLLATAGELLLLRGARADP